MAILTLELTDEQARSLSEDAVRQGLTIEEYALLRVLLSGPFAEQGSGMSFEEAIEYVYQKNSALYERLAGRRERVSQAIKRIVRENETLYRRLA